MENTNITDTHLPEEIVAKILARLPLRTISKFKSVCRRWKSAIESMYFRSLFLSLHQNTSISWSLLWKQGELIDMHGCETWDLPKSLGSYFLNIFERGGYFTHVDSSNGLVLIERYSYYGAAFVGNPILQQWVVLPSAPCSLSWWSWSALVTRVDEDGVVVSFKVVRFFDITTSGDGSSSTLDLIVYSSETGDWTWKQLHCPQQDLRHCKKPPMTLDGTLYISPNNLNHIYEGLPNHVNEVLIAHDLYGESNECQVIPLPDNNDPFSFFNERTFTTSTGFVMYIKTLPNDGNVLRVWRLLKNDDKDGSTWELVWDTHLEFIPFKDRISMRPYVPLTMHPFDHNIVYLWSREKCFLVSCNMETQNYHIVSDQSVYDDDDLHVNHSVCEKHVTTLYLDYQEIGCSRIKFQCVLPRWMGSIPRPPGTEILDTSSLFSQLLQEDSSGW